MPRFVGNIDSYKNSMELLEPEAALRRQTLYPIELWATTRSPYENLGTAWVQLRGTKLALAFT